eukprot:scaffold744_cov240-Pinguiococcus_pyrenoidosus.AAC.10
MSFCCPGVGPRLGELWKGKSKPGVPPKEKPGGGAWEPGKPPGKPEKPLDGPPKPVGGTSSGSLPHLVRARELLELLLGLLAVRRVLIRVVRPGQTPERLADVPLRRRPGHLQQLVVVARPLHEGQTEQQEVQPHRASIRAGNAGAAASNLPLRCSKSKSAPKRTGCCPSVTPGDSRGVQGDSGRSDWFLSGTGRRLEKAVGKGCLWALGGLGRGGWNGGEKPGGAWLLRAVGEAREKHGRSSDPQSLPRCHRRRMGRGNLLLCSLCSFKVTCRPFCALPTEAYCTTERSCATER